MPSRAVCIVNPKAGTARQFSPASLGDALHGRGLEAEVIEAAGPEVGQAVRRAVASGAERVIVAGGDGTLSAAAQALAGTDVAMAVLPAGTLNHFAKDLKVPLAWESALEVAAAGRVERVDLGEVNGRFFLNNSSLGVYPRIVMEREQQQRMGRGKWLAFCRALLDVSLRAPRVWVKVDSPERRLVARTPFLFVGNNAYELQGMHVGSRANLSGGRLYVLAGHGTGTFALARAAWQAFRGGEQAARCCLDAFETGRLRIETARRTLPVAVDGEVVQLPTPLEYRIHPRALAVVVPAGQEKAA